MPFEKVQINISYEYNHVGGFTIPEKVYEFLKEQAKSNKTILSTTFRDIIMQYYMKER